MDAYWWAIVTMTTVGYGDKTPKKVIGRAIAAVWMIIGIIWFAAFTASLSSSLTINRIGLGGIKGLTDLSANKVAVIKGTTSENFMRYHDVTVMVVETLDDLIRSLKDETAEAVVYDAPALMYIAKTDPEIKVVGEMFDVQKYGVAFPQGGNSPTRRYSISLFWKCMTAENTTGSTTSGFENYRTKPLVFKTSKSVDYIIPGDALQVLIE